MSRVDLDANCIVYLIEATSPLTSRLSRLECRVGPLRAANASLLALYDAFFGAGRLIVGDVTAAVVERATDLRARYRVKTPDAIHLATAVEERADVFVTGDAALARCTDVPVEVLEA